MVHVAGSLCAAARAFLFARKSCGHGGRNRGAALQPAAHLEIMGAAGNFGGSSFCCVLAAVGRNPGEGYILLLLFSFGYVSWRGGGAGPSQSSAYTVRRSPQPARFNRGRHCVSVVPPSHGAFASALGLHARMLGLARFASQSFRETASIFTTRIL